MTLNDITIGDFSFGDVDGSSESREPSFSELFYEGSIEENSYVEQLLTKKKFIIHGRKGTGKTLLAAYFRTQVSKDGINISKVVSYGEYIYEKLKEFRYEDVKKEEQTLFWKYVFLQQFVELIQEQSYQIPFWNVFDKIRIKQLYSETQKQFLEVQQFSEEYHSQNKLNSSLTAKNGLGAEVSSEQLEEQKTRLTHQQSAYFKKYKEIESRVLDFFSKSKVTYTIFFDDMDRLSEMMDDRNYFEYLMISMIYGAQELNRVIPGNSKIVLLLRSDVLKLLFGKSGDINKIITSGGIELLWYKSNAKVRQNPLISMILHKMGKSLTQKLSAEEVRERFFPKKDTVFRYMLSRSFGRPRDIVSFLNIYKSTYPSDRRITLHHLKSVEDEYSEWFYREIENELVLTGRYFELEKVLAYISEFGKDEFVFEEMLCFIDQRDEVFDNLLDSLSILVKLGALGIKLGTGNIEFYYRPYNIYKAVNEHTRFVVHYGLRRILSISIARDNSNEVNAVYL
ncbi:P-loop ATPase, Sll1717 family [Streptococcus acidominimus]|uniref:FunZ protein n=1 Tax=Streptococcus acidominimus TaxID=1326 RepID=A0A4Y9FM49_STRAI|nr:hypothetical protein [Streptococcus acidominimus]MBF0819141.1 hypothetical protein [Streptococcus acidominimus]MBF0838685.1 hypothetical protein [Streptococcus acidominimus]MBF0846822.1 hypothetical protein [Streptococcus danieliae]TFU30297.1 hypothetical protein E4U01_06770 [Streptococcus acidominimus]